MRILIAEDQDMIRRGLSKILGELPGAEVGDAADGEEAWAAYRNRPADLLLTDIVMPDMDGLELIRRVAEVGDGCVCMIISGYDKFEYAQSAMACGVRDYLLKPVRRERLLELAGARLFEAEANAKRRRTRYEAAWQAALAGDAEAARRSLAGKRAPSDGVMLRSRAGENPQVERAYPLCRHLGAPGLYVAYARPKEAPADVREASFSKGEPMVAPLLRLAGEARSEECLCAAVQLAMTYIQEHAAEPLTLTSVAAVAGLNPNYFSGLFAREIGRGFASYLQCVRVERAKKLMRETTLRSFEIAERVGFEDEKYFSRVFRKVAGVSPREYRAGKAPPSPGDE